MKPYIHQVQYYEKDRMGITHHSNYIRWMEEARVAFLEELGWGYGKLEAMGIVSPVTQVSCDFKKTTTFPDRIAIEVSIREFRGVKLFLSYRMINEETKEAAAEGQMVWKQEAYTREALRYADLVLACTDDPELNGEIYSVCKCLGIPVNVCSDRRKCDFYFPGIVAKDNVVIGVTAGGTDHRKAREVREKIERLLEEEEHE